MTLLGNTGCGGRCARGVAAFKRGRRVATSGAPADSSCLHFLSWSFPSKNPRDFYEQGPLFASHCQFRISGTHSLLRTFRWRLAALHTKPGMAGDLPSASHNDRTALTSILLCRPGRQSMKLRELRDPRIFVHTTAREASDLESICLGRLGADGWRLRAHGVEDLWLSGTQVWVPNA